MTAKDRFDELIGREIWIDAQSKRVPATAQQMYEDLVAEMPKGYSRELEDVYAVLQRYFGVEREKHGTRN